MALTPDTAAALKQALQAVQEECGDDPQYAELVDALHAAEQAIPDTGDEPAEHDAPEHGDDEGDDDPYSFEQAEKKHKERRKPKPKGDDAEDEGGNPFAKKGE